MNSESIDIKEIMEKVPQINKKLEKVLVNPEAENTFVLGETGSGKSTFICAMKGLNFNAKRMKWVKLTFSINQKATFLPLGIRINRRQISLQLMETILTLLDSWIQKG